MIEIASTAWGVCEDQAGNARPDLTASLSFSDGTAATVYADNAATSILSALTTNSNGEIPGFIPSGTYTLSVGSVTHQVEAVAGSTPQSSTANEPGTSVCVGTASQIVLPSNPARLLFAISNLDEENPVDLALGSDAAVGGGIRLQPFGPPFVLSAFTGIVYGIAQDANTCLGIVEV